MVFQNCPELSQHAVCNCLCCPWSWASTVWLGVTTSKLARGRPLSDCLLKRHSTRTAGDRAERCSVVQSCQQELVVCADMSTANAVIAG
jgi:hypothetical protein